MNFVQKIKTGTSLYTNLFLLRETPVLVYASGRVGSISMIYALKSAGVFAIKVEWLDTETWGSVRFCKKHIIDTNKPAKIITLVRDPVEVLCSLFFSKAGRGQLPLGKIARQEKNVEKLISAFETEILNSRYFSEHLDWFEQEFEPHLKLDVFSHPFDTENKFSTMEHPLYPTLILRADLLNQEKEEQVKKFLNIDNFTLDSLNVKSDRKNGDLYTDFINQLRLSDVWLDTIYNSKYAQHFFSKTEISDRKKKYSCL